MGQLAARPEVPGRGKEDSCPAGMVCPTLTVGEIRIISSILEMDS
jgi:hypothetical protein